MAVFASLVDFSPWYYYCLPPAKVPFTKLTNYNVKYIKNETTTTFFNCQAIENSRFNQDMGGSENGLLLPINIKVLIFQSAYC